MSIPSSRLLVATTAGSRPDFRASSICARCSRDTEPWCARAISTTPSPSAGVPLPQAARPVPPWPGCAAGPRRNEAPSGLTPAEPPGRSGARSRSCGSGSGTPYARSVAISLSRLVSRSASRRLLANTIVLRCCSTRSTIRSSTAGQMLARGSAPAALPPRTGPADSPRPAMSSTGTTTSISIVLVLGGWTSVTSRLPPRNRATSSTGRTVADRPIRWAGRSSSSSRRSSDSARCAPRLVPLTACTSSTMTVSTPRSDSRAALVSTRNSDSGVVMKTSGGILLNARRSAAGVSPERMPTARSGTGSPRRCAACRMPVSGLRRLRSTSTASALSGLTYSTRQRCRGSSGGGVEASRSSDHRNADSVLPEPVGATTRVSRPLLIASQAPSWAAVGAAKAAVNQVRVAGEKRSRALTAA